MLAFFFFLFSLSETQALTLSPQDVADRLLEKSARTQQVLLNSEMSKLEEASARSIFSSQLSLEGGQTTERADSLSGTSNVEDRTQIYSAYITKKFSYGTSAKVGYSQLQQNSTLNSFSRSLRDPNLSQNVGSLEVEQELLRNSFGKSDRAQLQAAIQNQTVSAIQKDENLEDLVMEALQLYWDSYVAKEQLKAHLSAREKYEKLVATVKRKSQIGFSNPGELSSVSAEKELRDQEVKRASLNYLSLLDRLLDLIQIRSEEDIEFKVAAEIPALPSEFPAADRVYRVIRALELQADNKSLLHDSASSLGLPQLNLVAQAKTTGVDSSPSSAQSEMFAGTKPTYYLGLKFKMDLENSSAGAKKYDAWVRSQTANYQLSLQQEAIRREEEDLKRRVTALYSIALSAVETTQLREKLVKEHENTYRQGRLDIAELIRSYNSLFQSYADRVRAIGNYHIALNQWAAHRDQLVRSPGRQ